MLKPHWIFLPLFMTASVGFAQSIVEKAVSDGGVVMSTDPAVVAEVERRAAEIVAARQQENQPQSTGASSSATTGITSGGTSDTGAKLKHSKARKGMRSRKHAPRPPAGSVSPTPGAASPSTSR